MKSFETFIGALVVAIAIAFLLYAGQFSAKTFDKTYNLIAYFSNASGIARGADVSVSGVKVGSVSDMVLDSATYRAKVFMAIDEGVKIPDDSSVKISSDGLLGGSHLVVEPGGSEEFLAANSEIAYTQGSVSLVDLLSQAVFGMSKSEKDDKNDNQGQAK